jgi:hypothetical protein
MFEVNAETQLALEVAWSLEWPETNENRHNADTSMVCISRSLQYNLIAAVFIISLQV